MSAFIKRKTAKDAVEEVLLADIPVNVDFQDLEDKSRGRLLSEKKAQLLKSVMADEKDDKRYSKEYVTNKLAAGSAKKKQINYGQSDVFEPGIIKIKGELYAIYKKIPLGKGAFGSVKLIQQIDTGHWYALKDQKLIKVDHLSKIIEPESEVLAQLSKRVGNLLIRKSRSKEYQKYDLVMPLAKGVALSDYLNNHQDMPAIRRLDIAIGAVDAVMDLHKKGYLHCDIKGKNMVYGSNKVELVDYSFALKKNEEGKAFFETNERGTPGYMAPELGVRRDENNNVEYSTETDVYALGVELHRILGIKMDDNSVNDEKIGKTFFNDDVELKKLITTMISEDPAERPKLEDVRKQLAALRQEFVPISTKKMGVINVADCVDILGNVKIIPVLQSFDTVILTDTRRHNKSYYNEIKHALEKKGISVQDSVLIAKNPDDIVENINRMEKSKQNETVVPHICYFQKKGKVKAVKGAQSIEMQMEGKYYSDYMNEIRKSSTFVATEKVNQVLNELLNHAMTSDKSTRRANLLIAAHARITRARDAGNITYLKLYQELHHLEKDMLKARKWSFLSVASFGMYTHKDVKKVKSKLSEIKREEMEVQDVKIPQMRMTKR